MMIMTWAKQLQARSSIVQEQQGWGRGGGWGGGEALTCTDSGDKISPVDDGSDVGGAAAG